MNTTPEAISRALDRALPTVQKPARYTGGEYNSVQKPWDSTAYRLAFVFPDIYDLGMSNLGLAALYDIINRHSDMLAERAYTPWVDMIAAMRREGIPLYSLESRHALVGSRSGAMHRLGDVVDVRLVEAAPVAGALRFELLSEGKVIPRGRKRDGAQASTKASKSRPGRSPREKIRTAHKGKSGKAKPGKSKRGKSWKR